MSGDDESSRQAPSDPLIRTRWVLVTALVVVGGLAGFLLGRFTAGDESPTTLGSATPTTGASDTTQPAASTPSASGPVLFWEPVDPEITAGYIAGVVNFQDRFLLYVSDSRLSPTGVSLWSSENGSEWSDEGVVIPGAVMVGGVFASHDRLLAYGSILEGEIFSEFAPPESAPAVWTSTDGVNWQQHLLPVTSDFEDTPTFGTAHIAAVTDQAGIALGFASSSVELTIVEALPPEIRGLLDQPGVGFGMSAPPLSVQVHGPFGLVLYSATIEELGLDPSLTEEAFMGTGGLIWTTTDFETWSLSEAEPFGAMDVPHVFLLGPGGDLLAFGFGPRGPTLWRSADGITWTSSAVRAELFDIALRGQALISSESTGFRTSIIRSLDGETWETITPDDLLDAEFTWHFNSVSASQYGIAATGFGFPAGGMIEEPEFQPTIIDKDEFIVTADEMRGLLTVSRDEEVLLRIPLHTDVPSEDVALDPVAGTLSFLDPESGEVLVTLTLEEIQQAQERGHEAMDASQEERVIVFSQDEISWSVQSVEEAFGVERGDAQLFAFDEFVLASVRDLSDISFMDPGPSTPPPVRIWIGTLP